MVDTVAKESSQPSATHRLFENGILRSAHQAESAFFVPADFEQYGAKRAAVFRRPSAKIVY